MNMLDFFFPKRCVGCNQLGAYICSQCLNRLNPLDNQICPVCSLGSAQGRTHLKCATKTSLDGLISIFPYRGLAKQLITKLKYKLITDLSSTLIELCASYGHFDPLPNAPLVTEVPLHPHQQRQRGFNQSALIAKGLAKYGNWQFAPQLLTRTQHTTSQMTLSGSKRPRDLASAFAANVPDFIKKQPLLLVDDVWITGTTIKECAKVLKQAGATSVWGFVLARS